MTHGRTDAVSAGLPLTLSKEQRLVSSGESHSFCGHRVRPADRRHPGIHAPWILPLYLRGIRHRGNRRRACQSSSCPARSLGPHYVVPGANGCIPAPTGMAGKSSGMARAHRSRAGEWLSMPRSGRDDRANRIYPLATAAGPFQNTSTRQHAVAGSGRRPHPRDSERGPHSLQSSGGSPSR